MAEAAKNLTPVALELGGETGNWCVVRKDADLKDAARKIAFFKLCNAGQICIHMMVKGVPFNGVGHSGMGAYHGEWGFREFTHPQTVLKGRTVFNLPLREHPYTGKAGAWKMKLLKWFER